MSNKLVISEDKLALLKEKMEEHKKNPGPLMPTLHDAQNIFGCIPLELQEIIANELNESVAKINGVVTFYSRFTLEPKGEHVISVCLGTACYVRGSQTIVDEFKKVLGIKSGETTSDGKITLLETRCIGACGLAPVFTLDEDVHGNSSIKLAKEVLESIH